MAKTDDDSVSVYRFDVFTLDCEKFELRRGTEPTPLTPRAFDVLAYLVKKSGRVVEKQELFERVWGETFVTDNSLMRAIREIRRALADDAASPTYIETIHKRGYRFIAELRSVSDSIDDPYRSAENVSPGGSIEHPSPEAGSNGHAPPRVPQIAPYAWRGVAILALALTAFAAVAVFALYYARGEKPVRTIAVMPLENSGSETEHLSDGISESIINSLSELPDVKVVARATAFRYRGEAFDPQKLRRELGVDVILTGRVLQSGDELTVQADLIDASDGSQIWGSRYTRKLAAVYELPGAIAIDLAKKLDLNLTELQARRLAKNYTENPKAYRLYSLGRFFWNKRSEDALNKSIEYFQQAIAEDPSYALAYAGLADSYAVMAISADLPPHEVYPKAKNAAGKALELDDTLVEAQATMLRIEAQYEWDWDAADAAYQRALALNPNYPMTHIYYVSYLVSAGRADEAIVSAQRAQELDPLSLVANAVVARAMFFAERYDDAIAQSQKTLEMDDNVYLARLILGRSLARKGNFDEAISELEKARRMPGANSESTSLLAHTFAVMGRTAEARRLLDEMQQLSESRYVQPFDLAIVHAGLGDKESAIELLERAYKDRNHQVPLIASVPEFENIRSDPRFADLVRRIRAER
jgi:DNA-binding winged helix-turn-helix (wHTH) protein/TolB-like protein/Tfp pilus assembly protein PilF